MKIGKRKKSPNEKREVKYSNKAIKSGKKEKIKGKENSNEKTKPPKSQHQTPASIINIRSVDSAALSFILSTNRGRRNFFNSNLPLLQFSCLTIIDFPQRIRAFN